jgi:hypothetical protein
LCKILRIRHASFQGILEFLSFPLASDVLSK